MNATFEIMAAAIEHPKNLIKVEKYDSMNLRWVEIFQYVYRVYSIQTRDPTIFYVTAFITCLHLILEPEYCVVTYTTSKVAGKSWTSFWNLKSSTKC